MTMRIGVPIALIVGAACASPAVTPSDREPMELVGEIAVNDPEAVAVGSGAVWVTAVQGVLRIDPATGTVSDSIRYEHTRLPGGGQIAILGDQVWVALGVGTSPIHRDPNSPPPKREPVYEDFKRRMVAIDTVETLGGIAVIDASTRTVRHRMLFLDVMPFSIALTPEGAWLPTQRNLALIDPSTYDFARFVDVRPQGGTESAVLAGGESLWVDAGDRIIRIDPRDGRSLAEIPVEGLRAMAYGDGALWATTAVEVVKIDPATNVITARVPIEDTWHLAAGDGVVLLRSFRRSTLYRIDAATAAITGTLDLGEVDCCRGLATGAGAGWVLTGSTLLKVSI